MTEHDTEILDESKKTLERLSDLSAFFEEPAILRIYLQTQVIHQLFVENEDIDVNKLELYHIQFSNTLIDLLEKIKKKNDRLVGMYESEIKVNEDMIEKIRTNLNRVGEYDFEKKEQAHRVARSIYSFHKALSSRSLEYPFTENISSFSIQFYKDHFYEVESSLQDKLLSYTPEGVYRNRYGLISKGLLNLLAETMYKISFVAGIRVGNMLMEVYKISRLDNYFIFIPAKNYFLSCEADQFPYKEWEAENVKKEQGVKELMLKNIQLERDIKENIRHIDQDVIALLEDNHKKISEINFLEDLENIDIQANTLKTMLETKMI